MNRVLLFVLLITKGLFSQTPSPVYSFFSAGHTYGNPNSPHYGLHYPFVDFIPVINNYPNMSLGVLTGDVVVSPTAAYWDSAQANISNLNMPVYIAAGNHDIGAEFVSRFENYYYSFIHNNDLFIVLTPGLDAWNISGAQLSFLENTLDSNYLAVNNVFVFLHELIWWSPNNQYQNVAINYAPHYPGSTNYDAVVKPLLLSYPNKITIFAGDLGCTEFVSPYMYDHYNNITLIGSGMGGGIEDNIIITDVYADSVHYNLVAINGSDPNALGELTSFSLVSLEELKPDRKFIAFPNPAEEYLCVKNELESSLNLKIYDALGSIVYVGSVKANSIGEIKTDNIKPGLYFIELRNDKESLKQKIIIR